MNKTSAPGTTATRLIEHRIRTGGNPAESAQLLHEIASSHSGDNLAFALHYNGFATQAHAEHDADALEVERTDAHVRAVAALIPLPIELGADMGGSFTLEIDLGTSTTNDPHDRAGIEAHEPGATWWIETDGGEHVETSTFTSISDPAQIADWITDRAIALGCPVSNFERPDWGTISRWTSARSAATRP